MGKAKTDEEIFTFEPPMADISWVRRKFLDIPYGEGKAQVLDIYLPDEGDGPFPLVLHIHGGGFAFGDKRDDHMNAYLPGIREGFAVASVEYRLSGEAKFPAAVLDCREAVRFLKENAGEYRIDPKRIGVIGGSAGGNLAAMLAMNIPNGDFYQEDAGAVRKEQPSVKAAISQFGPMHFSTMRRQAEENGLSEVSPDPEKMPEAAYLGVPIDLEHEGQIQKANPAAYASAYMCPILVQHGTKDHLVPFAQSEEFVNAVRSKITDPAKVTYTPIQGADHEDARFFSEPNMSFVWDYLKQHL